MALDKNNTIQVKLPITNHAVANITTSICNIKKKVFTLQ